MNPSTWSRKTVLGRLTMTAPLAVIALVIPFGLAIGELPRTVEFAPFVVSVLLFGLPHGAVDHLVPLRLGEASLRRSLLVVTAVYLVLGGIYLAVWLISPAVALVAFILITWFHWGQGDVFALRAFGDGTHIKTRSDRWLGVAVRGGLPMLVPLLAQPAAYREVVEGIIGLFNPAAAAALAPVFQVETRLWLGAGFGLLCLGSLIWTGRHVYNGEAGVAGVGWDAVEIGVLWLFFWTVPPVFAVGLYFALWHAVRHIGRLAIIDALSRQALSVGGWTTALKRFYRDAMPLTIVTLGLFAALYVAMPTDGSLEALLWVYLVGIAVVTLPHVAIVTWMDHKQYA